MKNQYFLLLFLLTVLTNKAISQTDGNYEYTKEFTWGINKNTNGGLIGGFVMKFAKALDEKQFQTIGFELINVKHPKEFKRESNSGGLFQFGKSNHLFAVRGQYGRDFILFKKAPQSGVQVNISLATGLTIGVVAPYFVVTLDNISVPYSRDISFGEISGAGNFFDGLSKAKLTPGLNAKASISFEMGVFKSSVTGFELGTLIEAYPRAIELMPNQNNRAVFVSAFLTIFYGHRK